MSPRETMDGALTGLHALVLEADAITAFEIEEQLRDLGAAEVRLSADTPEARQALGQARCDLAVIDIGAGGDHERAELIDSLRLGGARVVALTSCAPGDPPLAGLDGAAIVYKPFTLANLTAGVVTAMAGSGGGRKAAPSPVES